MPAEIITGQSWSAWVPARQQWLSAVVIQDASGQATLKFDARYGLPRGEDERQADHTTMLSNKSLYRFLADRAAA